MEKRDLIQHLIDRMQRVNCGMDLCKHFCEDEDDWPDCKLKETKGFLRGLCFKDITCPWFEDRD